MLRADDVNQTVPVCQMDGIITGGVKADGAFGVQVVNRIVKQVAAVGAFLHFNNAVQVYLNAAGAPQAIK